MRKRKQQQKLPVKKAGPGPGGKRAGAGRKPKGEKAGASHKEREAVSSKYPVHVTVKLVEGLPSLRQSKEGRVLAGAFRTGCEGFGFRLVHYSIQSDHLHLIAEAKGRDALSRGMQGLLVRIARRLNKAWGRKGSMFGDRYQTHVLKSPKEVRDALCHVLHNAKKHCRLKVDVDPFSSGAWFDGWKEKVEGLVETPLAEARTWMLTVGWREQGLISVRERPSPA